MTDLDAAARLARVDWERDDTGEVVGFTLRRLRCGSPLHAAGLRNGDVIHQVNGRDITSIPEALAAYARLKRGDHFRLDISRRGARRRLSYTVGQG
ncbi:MAG: PDZ domain-containing protein [Alphaproteobacteria bacterium]|nr:PDZ domain-containing protein [Alphaproteobacteria bacterium]MCB9794553.1 PDZ domain-containing protein [Alphaproteobacteria bacterium]